jgi:hypothetical protein
VTTIQAFVRGTVARDLCEDLRNPEENQGARVIQGAVRGCDTRHHMDDQLEVVESLIPHRNNPNYSPPTELQC